ncbi:MAG: hypothetical protein ACK40V_06960 [Anaerolineales bacterium]
MTTENSKPSNLALVSIILPIIILLVWCAYVITFGALTENTTDEASGFAMIFGGGAFISGATIALSLAGIILGVIAMRKNDSRKRMAIIGLVINLLCLLPYILLLVFLSTFSFS